MGTKLLGRCTVTDMDPKRKRTFTITTSLSVGKIEPPDFLWSGLVAISTSSTARNGVFLVHSNTVKGRIGVFCNRYISGAVLDGSDKVGIDALRELLSAQSGIYGFRCCAPAEGLELKQDLAIDLTEIVAAQAEFKGKTPDAYFPETARPKIEQSDIIVGDESEVLSLFESLGASGSYYDGTTSNDDTALGLPPTPTASASSAPSTSAAIVVTEPETSYLEWLSGPEGVPASIPTGGLMPVLSGVKREPGDESERDPLDDLEVYQKLIEQQSKKVSALIEDGARPVGSAPTSSRELMEDLRLFNDFLLLEQRRAESWLSADLDAIKAPSDGSKPAARDGRSRYADECEDLVSVHLLKTIDRQKIEAPLPPAPKVKPERHYPWQKWNERSVVATAYLMTVVIAVSIVGFALYRFDAEKLLSTGISDLQNNKPEDAVVQLGTLMAQHGASPRALYYRALAYGAAGQPERGLEDINQALAMGEPRRLALPVRASLYLKTHEFDKAIADCTQLIREDANNPEPYQVRAVAYNQLGKFQDAIYDCTHGLELAKDKLVRARLLRERAVAYSRLQMWKEATADLEQSVPELKDENSYLLRAHSYRSLKEYEKATADYSELIARKPKSPSAYIGRGICEAALDKSDQAIVDFDQALQLNPLSVEALIQRGSVYLKQDRWREAADDFHAATNLNPTIVEANEKLSTALHHLKSTLTPIELVQAQGAPESVKLPKDKKGLMDLGYRYFDEQAYDQAIMCFTEAARLDPKDAVPRKYLAYSFERRGDFADALMQFQAISKFGPLSNEDKILLARCLTSCGRANESVRILLDVVWSGGDPTEAQIELAKAYFKAGKKTLGTAICTDAIRKASTESEKRRFEALMNSEGEAVPERRVQPKEQ
jgi:tetratricopeptide (TPR) repeat protein